MPPKVLDITVEVPEAHVTDEQVAAVVVTDAGSVSPSERVTHVHFYATALATYLENHFKRASSGSSSAVATAAAAPGR
jgi:hypothetical protein